MANVTAEDTPQTLRQTSSQGKGKRLKLYADQQHCRELRRPRVSYVQEESCSGSDDVEEEEEDDEEGHQAKQFATNTRKYRHKNWENTKEFNQEELSCEADGVRRSTRKKNLSYGSMNQSWIFGTGSIKVATIQLKINVNNC